MANSGTTENSKIKVIGYTQEVKYSGGIQLRNFSSNITTPISSPNDGGTTLFTLGSFNITTNTDQKKDKNFLTDKFSNFVSLSDLNVSLNETKKLVYDNSLPVTLNLDKSNLNNYALFGSLTEFIRVSLESIITNWPASLYVTPIYEDINGNVLNDYTFKDYYYDELTNLSYFKVNTNLIINKFEINYLTNGFIIDSFSSANDLRNLTVNYSSYNILTNGLEYPVNGFTGSTQNTNEYIYFSVVGDVFSGLVEGNIYYHIKPNSDNVEYFFKGLPNFEGYLLNRLITPKYTATFNYPVKSDSGIILFISKTLTWPVTDGYNIDFDTTYYEDYVNKLLDISNDNDLYSSNLMNRFLVSESITNFDTSPVNLSEADQETSGQKMNKLLQIYGVSFDSLNNYINGISLANVVTYDGKDNTPDVNIKNLAKVLGWDLMSSVLEDNLVNNYIKNSDNTFSGHTIGLTPVEADYELWRRLILNTPWLWKSKGTRKAIEFLLRFIGIPDGLVKLNEYVYKVKSPINVDLFIEVLKLNGLDTDLSIYPIDEDGYPYILQNTPNMYFQNNGLWYRETGGSGATIDILTGNNPHVGPYDGGYRFINQFKELIPNFSSVTITSETITNSSINLFTNYNSGIMSDYSGDTYVDAQNIDGSDICDCIVVDTYISGSPVTNNLSTDCGCDSSSNDSLNICIDRLNVNLKNCDDDVFLSSNDENSGVLIFKRYQYNSDGTIYKDNSNNIIYNTTPFINKTCCKAFNGTPFIYNQVNNGNIVNSGYICCNSNGNCGCTIACKWMVDLNTTMIPKTSQNQYLVFNKEDLTKGVVTPDGCNCVAGYTIPVSNIVDPFTNITGYGCQLTQSGVEDMKLGKLGNIYKFYNNRSTGITSCFGN